MPRLTAPEQHINNPISTKIKKGTAQIVVRDNHNVVRVQEVQGTLIGCFIVHPEVLKVSHHKSEGKRRTSCTWLGSGESVVVFKHQADAMPLAKYLTQQFQSIFILNKSDFLSKVSEQWPPGTRGLVSWIRDIQMLHIWVDPQEHDLPPHTK